MADPQKEEGDAGEQVELLGMWASPFVFKVVWALRIKGVPYEYVEEDLRNKSDRLLQLNPVHGGKVPVLVYRGKPVAESEVILEFIDEAWPDRRRILPQDPLDRAVARFLVRFGQEKVSPPIWKWFTARAGPEQDAAHAAAVEQLQVLGAELAGGGGGGKPFFGGEDIGLVDLSLGPLAYVIPIYEEIVGARLITEEKLPSLHAWAARFLSAPVVKGHLPPMDALRLRYQAVREAFLNQQSTRVNQK